MKKFGEDPLWRWYDLLKISKNRFDINVDFGFTNEYYYGRILPSYRAETRHYHTLEHIENMLYYVRDFKGTSHTDRCLLKWAIWFHDLIYDPKSNKNEIHSANQLYGFARVLGFKDEDIKTMWWLVAVTTHKGNPQTRLEDIICDLDLKGFSSDRSILNGELVKKEYSHVSSEDFYKGRIQFLAGMLKKEYIYHTDEYRNTLETQARHNILKEIETIKSKL